MSTVWETHLAADNVCKPHINHVLGRAGHVVSQSHPGKIEDAPSVTCVDVYTEWPNGDTGPTFRMFKNGAVDKGVEVETPQTEYDPAAREAAVTLILDLAKSLDVAATSHYIIACNRDDDLGNSTAHRYLMRYAQAIADILRSVPDLL